ncbi:hypothetical protein OJAV_G00202630 [Oryzias javanicus]|uniref:Fibronectin type-III domain-containing protein n=1 Tax=Oryzias javanicus TaxID=123683 RepID=A0A437C538_ORYJA|nr:hypothetical protein OJAV_G00202630 [Oryzias javanicus]
MVMTSRVWIVTWLPLVLAAVGELPAPTRLTLTSRNLQHLLTWEPGPGTPPGTTYRVTKSTARHVETEVEGCGSVLRTCNLTGVLGDDPFDSYDIRVEAVNRTSPAAEVARFKPAEHLDLPLLTLTPRNRSLSIELRPPHDDLSRYYKRIQYQLQIRDSSKPAEPVLIDRVFMGEEVRQHLSYGTRYCVSVRFSDTLDQIFSNFSQPVCADTDSLYSTELLLPILLCLLLTVLVVFVGLFLWTRILCLSKRPSVLTTIDHLEKVLVQSLPESVSSLSSIRPAARPGGQTVLSRLTPATPPSHTNAPVTEDPRRSAEPPGSTAGEGTGDRKPLDGGAGAQEVDFLTLIFHREEEEEEHLLSFSELLQEGAGPEEELAGGVPATLPPQQVVVEEEDDDGSGYMCR